MPCWDLQIIRSLFLIFFYMVCGFWKQHECWLNSWDQNHFIISNYNKWSTPDGETRLAVNWKMKVCRRIWYKQFVRDCHHLYNFFCWGFFLVHLYLAVLFICLKSMTQNSSWDSRSSVLSNIQQPSNEKEKPFLNYLTSKFACLKTDPEHFTLRK